MVSKSQIKLITSLEQKKNRTKTGLFVVEGKKGISELLNSNFELDSLFTTQLIFNSPQEKTYQITEPELQKISRLKTAQIAVGLFKIPNNELRKTEGLIIALDGVRDPGNLGTIIRLCDWFGVEQLICSKDTVDCFNSKVVQASMGSIARVNIFYVDLEEFLKENKKEEILGAFLDGSDIYTTSLPIKGILLLGNEANGISSTIEKLVTQKVNIPQFGNSEDTESLNVATATAILLSEFRRQENY